MLINPDVSFEIQRPGEEVLLIVRQHPLTQFPWIFNVLVLSFFTILGNFFLPNFLHANQLIVFNIFAIVFIFAYTWLNFLLWYFTVGIVTNQRILDLDFYNIIYKEFAATTLVDVTELTTKVGGFFGSIFDFGTVYLQTHGLEQNIAFENVPQPSTIVRIINELKIENP